MPKGRISIDQIVENGLESQEGLIEEFPYPDEEVQYNKQIVSGLLQAILPSPSIPKKRRFTSGYRRFVVLVWMIQPDAFGSATVKDIAEQLDTTGSAVYKIRDELKALIGSF